MRIWHLDRLSRDIFVAKHVSLASQSDWHVIISVILDCAIYTHVLFVGNPFKTLNPKLLTLQHYFSTCQILLIGRAFSHSNIFLISYQMKVSSVEGKITEAKLSNWIRRWHPCRVTWKFWIQVYLSPIQTKNLTASRILVDYLQMTYTRLIQGPWHRFQC